MTVNSRAGIPTRRPTASAATASGGPTIAPRASAAPQGRSGTSRWATTPTASVVASTRPTESSPMARALSRKPATLLCSAAL